MDSEENYAKADEDYVEEIELPEDIPGSVLDDGDYKETFILTSVMALQKENGYSTGADVDRELNERWNVDWSTGTIYPMLHDMHEEGYLVREERAESKDYFITKEGVEEVEESLNDLLDLISSIGEIYSSIEGEKPDRIDEMDRLIQEF